MSWCDLFWATSVSSDSKSSGGAKAGSVGSILTSAKLDGPTNVLEVNSIGLRWKQHQLNLSQDLQEIVIGEEIAF